MTNDQPINYSYLAGNLQGAISSMPYTMASFGMIVNDAATVERVQRFMQKVLDDAKESERQYSNR